MTICRGTTRVIASQPRVPFTDAGAQPTVSALGGFIGDYIEGTLVSGNRYYVGYKANYRQMQVLGIFGPPFNEAPPMNQQDNLLAITGRN